MKNLLLVMVALLALGCGDESDVSRDSAGETGPNTTMDVGKGDDPSQGQPEIDLCAEFELYGDGECHTFCETPDSDCSEEELEAARDICEEEGRYGDGQCDTDCHFYDTDCDEPVDVCFMEARYADGTCDTDCTYVDSDCDDYEALSASEITEDEAAICERYTGHRRVPIHEVAASLCIEREDASIVDCIVQCVEAFESN